MLANACWPWPCGYIIGTRENFAPLSAYKKGWGNLPNRRELIRLLVGYSDSFSLEHRLFNIFSLAAFFFSILLSIVNLAIKLPLILILTPLSFGLLLAFCFYVSRKKKVFQLPVKVCITAMLFMAPVVWIYNGGSTGGSQYFLIFIGILAAIVRGGRLRYYLMFVFILLLSALISIEYLYPQAITYFTSPGQRYISVLFGFNLSALTIVLIFTVFADGYRAEQQRVKQYAQNMEEIAITDGLTGLYNHRFVRQRLEEEISKARRYKRKLSVIMLDIDHFKKLNDTQGHQFGDYVLKRIAEILQQSVRNTDTIGRYGGEEFIIVCSETGLAESYMLANRLRAEIERSQFKRQVQVTISGGVAELHEENIQQLVEKADRCLYSAKRLGRNRIGM